MDKINLLLTGGSGLVGEAVWREVAFSETLGTNEVARTSTADTDLREWLEVENLFENNKPDYVILKFNHINDEFLFKNIYMQPGTNADIFTDGDDNEYVYEYRYDSNMNLVSTYKQYLRESKFPKTDELHVKKVNEMGNQVDIDYVAGAWPTSKEARDFTNLFKGLEEQKIIVNKSEFYGLCGYGMKKNSDVIYLEIGKYESTE